MRIKIIGRKVLSVVFIASSSSGFSALAQAPKSGRVAAGAPPAAVARCSGAWTGNVTYTRTQTMTDSKTVQRVSNRGRDDRNFEMRYNYKASVAVVESPEKNGSSIGKGNIDHTMTSVEITKAREENSCDRGKTFRVMWGVFESKTENHGQASNVDSNVHVGINADGTYSVSVGLPPIQGLVSGKQSSSFSGQCTTKEGKTTTLPPTPSSIDGNSLTSDGKDRVNPSDPNQLSGSFTRQGLGVTETITWNLKKCGAPLRITDIQFEEMKFPNWNDWHAIAEQRGTVDGNFVKIKAKVLNASGETKYADLRFKETYKGDKWDGARPDAPLKDDVVSVRVEPNTEETVELMWDSSGYSWFDDGRPRLVQRVKAELEENNKKIDEMTKNLKIAPRPLVLVHGLWSNWKAWEAWQNILTTSHSYDWKAYPVGEDPTKGSLNTGGSFLSTTPTASIGENARELERYVDYAQRDRNAWHVDLVAHSLGGLISRYYISQIMPTDSQDGRPKVTRLVMLGTPNLGSPCADVMNVAFEMLGKNVEAVRQLRQDQVANFNSTNKLTKGVKFSALAGNPLPTICKDVAWNDGVVTVPSAKYGVADTAESKSLHTDLTGTSDFSNFVKPRVAIGPKGDHKPAMPAIPTQGLVHDASSDSVTASALVTESSFVSTFAAGGGPSADMNGALPTSWLPAPDGTFAKSVKLKAKETIEIDVPVETARNFGITFMADPTVSVTLVDDKGMVAGKNLAKSPESRGWFRSIFVDRPTQAGIWKLRLENTGDAEYEAILASWKDAGK